MARLTKNYPSKIAIYALLGVPLLNPFYIGGAKTPKTRIYWHANSMLSFDDLDRAIEINRIGKMGGWIRLCVIEWVNEPKRYIAEEWWIGEMLMRGHYLTNSVHSSLRGLNARMLNRHCPSTPFISPDHHECIESSKKLKLASDEASAAIEKLKEEKERRKKLNFERRQNL